MEIQQTYLEALCEDLREKGYCPHLAHKYDDQWWIELCCDCERRKPAATENPKMEISIQGTTVCCIVTGLDQLDQTSRWMDWPRIDLNDPNSFEQIYAEIERFEKVVESSLEAGYAGSRIIDVSVIISAYGPRPDKVR